MTQVCESRLTYMRGVEIDSDTSDRTYTVKIDQIGTTVPDHCTCQGWVMKRNRLAKKEGVTDRDEREARPSSCKHTEAAHLDRACGWASKPGDPYIWDDECPECGRQVFDLDDDTADAAPVDPELAAHELQNMARRLKGLDELPEPVKLPLDLSNQMPVCDQCRSAKDTRPETFAVAYTADMNGMWLALCRPCLDDFWRGSEYEDHPDLRPVVFTVGIAAPARFSDADDAATQLLEEMS